MSYIKSQSRGSVTNTICCGNLLRWNSIKIFFVDMHLSQNHSVNVFILWSWWSKPHLKFLCVAFINPSGTIRQVRGKLIYLRVKNDWEWNILVSGPINVIMQPSSVLYQVQFRILVYAACQTSPFKIAQQCCISRSRSNVSNVANTRMYLPMVCSSTSCCHLHIYQATKVWKLMSQPLQHRTPHLKYETASVPPDAWHPLHRSVPSLWHVGLQKLLIYD